MRRFVRLRIAATQELLELLDVSSGVLTDRDGRFLMSQEDLEVRKLQWRKSRRSANNGACVEVAPVDGRIAVRDSMNPVGGRLLYPAPSWQVFTTAIKAEQYFECDD